MNHVFTTLDTWFLDTVSFRDLAFHYSSNTFYVHSRPYPNNCSLALVWIPSILPWLFIHSLFPNTHDWTIFWLLPTYYPSFPHILLPFKPILNFMDNLYIILLWELVHKEEWGPKNWCFQIVVLEKTLESPLGCKDIKPVNSKGNQPWIFVGSTDAEVPIVWPPEAKKPAHWKRPWCWERLKVGGEGDDRRWDG